MKLLRAASLICLTLCLLTLLTGCPLKAYADGGASAPVYKDGVSGELEILLYMPENRVFADNPVFVFFHGGAWAFGGAEDIADEFAPLLGELRGAGFAVASVEYSLTGDGAKWKDCAADALDAVQWLYDHADEYDLDRDKIVVGGYSSGAHLALTAAYGAQAETLAADGKAYTYRPVYCVDIAGPVNLGYIDDASGADGYASSALDEYIPLLFDSGAEDYYDCLYDANPLNAMSRASRVTPLLVIAGENDAVVPKAHVSDAYQAALSSGVEAEYIEIANMTHLFEPHDASDPMGMTFDELCALIVKRCADAAGLS